MSGTQVSRSVAARERTEAKIRRLLLSVLPATTRGDAEQCSVCAEALGVFAAFVSMHALDVPQIKSISVKPGSRRSAAKARAGAMSRSRRCPEHGAPDVGNGYYECACANLGTGEAAEEVLHMSRSVSELLPQVYPIRQAIELCGQTHHDGHMIHECLVIQDACLLVVARARAELLQRIHAEYHDVCTVGDMLADELPSAEALVAELEEKQRG